MRYALGTVFGFALLAFGLTCLCYGIAQAIEIGNCGTDRYGRSVGPACPSGTGEMIAAMVGGSFVSIFGTGFLAIRGRPGEAAGVRSFGMGIAVGQLMFWAAAIVAGGASVALAIADVDDSDTRPGMEIVYAVAGPLVLFAVIGALVAAGSKKPKDASGPWGRPAAGGGAAAAMPGISGLPGNEPSNPFGAPPPPPSAGSFGSAPPAPSSFAFGATTPEQSSAAAFGTPPPPPPPSPSADVYAQLDQLAALHRSGALSDAEFEDAKARILGNL